MAHYFYVEQDEAPALAALARQTERKRRRGYS
jgi:hypothetical protein